MISIVWHDCQFVVTKKAREERPIRCTVCT